MIWPKALRFLTLSGLALVLAAGGPLLLKRNRFGWSFGFGMILVVSNRPGKKTVKEPL